MAKDPSYLKMVSHMKANGKKIRLMAMVHTDTTMGQCIKVNGRTTSNMDLVFINGRPASITQEVG